MAAVQPQPWIQALITNNNNKTNNETICIYVLFSGSILSGMQSKNPAVVAKATRKADLFLHDKGKSTLNVDGLRVMTNKTIINKKAFESNPMQNDATSPGKTCYATDCGYNSEV
jgi:hypothetical protein